MDRTDTLFVSTEKNERTCYLHLSNEHEDIGEEILNKKHFAKQKTFF